MMTFVGSQGVKGPVRGSPIEGANGTLYPMGRDCQATTAAYNYTQFWDNGREKTMDQYAGPNKNTASSNNLEGALGLAKVHQKAVAIPRGDCNNRTTTSQRKTRSEWFEKVTERDV